MWKFELIDNKEEYKTAWSQQNGHLLQSWEWGEIKKGNWSAVRILATKEHQTLAISLLIRQVTPIKIKLGYVGRFNFSDESLSQALLDYLANTKLADIVIYEPNNTEENLAQSIKTLPHYPTHVQPDYSSLIDLTAGEEQLYKLMRGNYRRSIKNAIKQGLHTTIHEDPSDLDAIKSLYTVLTSVTARTSYIIHSYEYFQRMWQELASNNMAKIMLVWQGNDLLGGQILSCDNTTVYEFYSGVNLKGRDLEAGFLLKWDGLKASIAWDKVVYDQWGVAPLDKNGEYIKDHPLSSISKFKQRFGGKTQDYATTRYQIVNKMLGSLVVYLQPIQSLLIKLKKLVKV